MGDMSKPKTLRSLCLSLACLAAPAGVAADPPFLSAEVAGGAIGFVADEMVWEGLVGADVRLHLRPEISIGPEISYMKGEGHSHLLLTGIVNRDFPRRANGESRQLVPFVKVGAGWSGSPRDIFTGFGVTGGGGVRFRTKRGVTLGTEARIGWTCCGELNLRATGTVGMQFGQ